MKDKRILVRLALIAIVAIVGYFQKDKLLKNHDSNSGNNKAPAVQVQNTSNANTVIKNAAIKDMDGSVAYRGDVDLQPTLDRIKAGQKHSHKNDGSVFGNREGRLPKKNHGYYREYVVPTPNIRHAGPQRLVIGSNGEIYYTGDHYKSFTRINS